MKAWILTIENGKTDNVLLVLNSRLSSKNVKMIAENLYSVFNHSIIDQINRFKYKIDQAEYCEGHQRLIHCGHNPPIFARLVDNLQVRKECDQTEIKWKEKTLTGIIKSSTGKQYSVETW